jgi:eukaryotic-like serine/threonine-protein kinase
VTRKKEKALSSDEGEGPPAMINAVKASFTERLVASRLISEQQLESAQNACDDDETQLGDYLVQEELLTPFQLRQLRSGATSFFVGKYVVLDCLGRGGNGVVFKARHTLMPNRFVALKTLDTQNLHHNNEAITRFKREIEIVAQLEHPNVVRAYDVLETRTQLYLVLEFVPGQDLGMVVKERGPLPIGEAVDYAVQAARGLAYAHECGIIHRDLKPANLLLTPAGIVKLTDLGLARMHVEDSEAELTMRGRCLGTPEFMAPEQAEDASKADHRSDLYALGSTLFHLLTAQLPVKGSTYLHTLQQLLMVAPRPLSQARADVPPALAEIVDRLRARDPASRPANAAEVIELLEPFAHASADDPRNWSGQHKAALVLDVLQGRTSAGEVCTQSGLDPEEFEKWQQRFLEAAQQALDPTADSREDDRAELIRELHAQIGAQAMAIQGLKKRLGEK